MASLRPRLLATCGLALLVAGCGGMRMSEPAPALQAPSQITAAPTQPVDMAALPPLEAAEAAPAAPAPASMASVGTSGGSLSERELIGGWQLASGAAGCEMFLTMTSWTGGYRASTRGCAAGTDLANVNAWSYDSGQIVLKDGSGGVVARMAAQSGTAMNGATAGGQAVSASRSG